MSYSLQELFASYKTWVSCNPQIAGDVESTVKWMSYFITGRINSSNVISELVYSLSNLLVLFNDRIIHNSLRLGGTITSAGERLKTWMTVLDYSEVFIEVTFRKVWGEKAKWAIVTLVQIFKCISRLVLLFHYKESIIKSPPIGPLKRNKLIPVEEEARLEEETRAQFNSATFTLKRSGRVIRTVHAAPPINCRSWKPPVRPLPCESNCPEEAHNSSFNRRMLAETIYAVKPVVHLSAMYCFGQKAWKPFVLALGMDLASLHLYKHKVQMNKQQRLELSRRTIGLLLYALRSPFYEKHSADRLQALLKSLAANVPLARLICTPIASYIPLWQDTYFYMWST